MPGAEFYKGLDLAGAVEKLAGHHYEPDNRHISSAEFDLLNEAADTLRGRVDPEPMATNLVKVLMDELENALARARKAARL